MIYGAGFDVSALSGLGTLTVATAGKPNVVITLGSVRASDYTLVSSALFFQHSTTNEVGWRAESADAATKLQNWSRVSWAKALQTAIQTEATVQGWTTPSNFTIVMSATTAFFTYAYTVANFSMTWTTDAGRALCSIAASANQSGAQSYVGTVVPTYAILPTQQAASCPGVEDGLNYEPANIATHVQTDNGDGHGIARPVSPLYRDWIQQYETKAKTMRLAAAAAHPFTFEALFEQCRGHYPFVVDDGGFDRDNILEAFFFRTEGTIRKYERASVGNASQFHIPFRTVVVGEAYDVTGA